MSIPLHGSYGISITHTHIYIYKCVCIYIYIHTVYIYIYVCVCSQYQRFQPWWWCQDLKASPPTPKHLDTTGFPHLGNRLDLGHWGVNRLVKAGLIWWFNAGWWFGTFFPYIGKNNPNWLIFFSGVETTNQNVFIMCDKTFYAINGESNAR